MGQSTDAILFYGYCWDEETSKPWTIGKDEGDDTNEDEDDGWEERYANLLGLHHPTAEYPTRPSTPENNWGNNIKDWTPEEKAVLDKYSAYWDAKHKLSEKAGVEVDTHCSCDYPMPFVAIKKSKIITSRGDMNQIKSLEIDPTWNTMLKDFCKLMGISLKGKRAAWWLVSNWC